MNYFTDQLKRVYLDQRRHLDEIERDIQRIKRLEGDQLAEKHETLRGIMETEAILEQHGIDAGELYRRRYIDNDNHEE